MSDCCKEYRSLEDVTIEDSSACGSTVQYDLEDLLTSNEIALSPDYDLLMYGGNYVDSISLNGSVVEIELKNPDNPPYEEVIIGSMVSDNFKYRVRVKIKILDRCADSSCAQGDACNPCTGDCEQGEPDAVINIEDPTGNSDARISII